MALPRSLFRKLRTSIKQYEATTGRRVSSASLRALMEAELSASAARLGEAGRFEEAKRANRAREALAERAARTAFKAARFQGAVNIAELGLIGAVLDKRFKLGIGKKVGEVTESITAPIKGAASKAISVVSGAKTGGTTISQEIVKYQALEAGAPPAVAGPSAGAGAGVVSTAASIAAPAAIGYGAGRLGAKIPIGKGKTTAQVKGGIAGGGAVALLLPTLGPVGIMLGAVSGIVGGGKVICTELWRQGYLPKYILELDSKYAKDNIDKNTFIGYWLWSKSVVRCMQHDVYGPPITFLVKPFGLAWAYEMAHKVDNRIKGSKLGWVLHRLGVPICRILGKIFGGEK